MVVRWEGEVGGGCESRRCSAGLAYRLPVDSLLLRYFPWRVGLGRASERSLQEELCQIEGRGAEKSSVRSAKRLCILSDHGLLLCRITCNARMRLRQV